MSALVFMVVAAAAWAADNDGEARKEALAEKHGDAAKEDRAADIEKMRSFETVTSTLEVAVLSCRPAKLPEPAKNQNKSNVNVTGEGWAALAGALISAANNSSSASREEGGDGRVLVQIDMQIKNTGNRTQLVRPEDFALATPEGYTVSYNLRTYDAPRPLAGVNLPPGATTGGTLIFILEPFDEYKLHYYNNLTEAAGVKHVLLMRGD